jgi:hypothetical protein
MANLSQVLTLISIIIVDNGNRAAYFKRIMVNESVFDEKFQEIGIVKQKLSSEVVCVCLNEEANECKSFSQKTMIAIWVTSTPLFWA